MDDLDVHQRNTQPSCNPFDNEVFGRIFYYENPSIVCILLKNFQFRRFETTREFLMFERATSADLFRKVLLINPPPTDVFHEYFQVSIIGFKRDISSYTGVLQ